MGRRGDSIGSILLRIVKDQEQYRSGWLRPYPNHWIFSDAGCTNAGGYHLPAHINDPTDRLISLKTSKGVNSCPTPPEGDFPIMKGGGHCVPWKLCLKCPHHINSVRPRGHYCAELKRIRAEEKSGLQTATETLGKAVQMAKELIP